MEALTVGCHSVLIAVAEVEADIGGQGVARVDDLEFDLTVGPIIRESLRGRGPSLGIRPGRSSIRMKRSGSHQPPARRVL